VLQPVIDIVRYRAFCERIAGELRRVCSELHSAKVPAVMRVTRIGEMGSELLALLDELQPSPARRAGTGTGSVGGEATLRVCGKQVIRLTFQSPSTLVAQTAQANVNVSSMPQLAQMLQDEVELVLLERLTEIGRQACGDAKALWFVDRVTSRAMGRWDGNSASVSGSSLCLNC
jgi:mediator of RNA polymerase II transcription subunit 17